MCYLNEKGVKYGKDFSDGKNFSDFFSLFFRSFSEWEENKAEPTEPDKKVELTEEEKEVNFCIANEVVHVFRMGDQCVKIKNRIHQMEKPDVEFVVKDHAADCFKMFAGFIDRVREKCEKEVKETSE